jgi:uncharacterized protein YbjQ (UPF0145 family)
MIYEGLYTTDTVSGRAIELKVTVVRTAIVAANILKDLREHITNTFGGRMKRYEEVTSMALDTALRELLAEAREAGYDGLVGLRISHPVIVEGGAEIVVCGTAFVFLQD